MTTLGSSEMELGSSGALMVLPSATKQPAQALLFTGAAILLATWGLLSVLLRLFGRKADSYKNVHIFTFANHKGGVGKSTTAFFVAKELASKLKTDAEGVAPFANVLVIDASVYCDLTKLLTGNRTSAPVRDAGCTIEAAGRRARYTATSWFSSFQVERFIKKVSDINPKAPSNLFVMANHGEASLEGAASAESDESVSVVAQTIRKALSTSSTPWIVLIDTDGGTTHQLTKLALCVADYIVVPTNADALVLDRIRVMLTLMEGLRVKGFSKAVISTVFFNRFKPGNTGGAAEAIGLSCMPYKTTYDEMTSVVDKFEELRGEFPHLLRELEHRKNEAGDETFFAGVRDGGETMVKVMNSPYSEKLSDVMASELAQLTTRIEHKAARRPAL